MRMPKFNKRVESKCFMGRNHKWEAEGRFDLKCTKCGEIKYGRVKKDQTE